MFYFIVEKDLKMKKALLALVVSLVSVNSFSHAPFVAPSNFIVAGGHTAVFAGFAELPFDSEVAIRGFEFSLFNPNGEKKALPLTNTKAVSVADVETSQEGTYQVIGQRKADIKYANLDQRWLRVLDTKDTKLKPLSERDFISELEVNEKTPQVSVKRFDDVITYFSKGKSSKLVKNSDANLTLEYSVHPNELKKNQPLMIDLAVKGRVAKNFNVEVEKQHIGLGEKDVVMKTISNNKGKVILNFSETGAYVVTVSSPDTEEKVKPIADVYRTIISLNVSE